MLVNIGSSVLGDESECDRQRERDMEGVRCLRRRQQKGRGGGGAIMRERG